MIQRIQSLYLLAALVLMVVMLILPFAEIAVVDGTIYNFGSGGLARLDGNSWCRVSGALPLLILIIAIAFLLLANIFLFRKRRLQMRLCTHAIILEFGLMGLGCYYFFLAFRDIEAGNYALRFPVIIPILSIVLLYLAFRAIRKDDILVRSIDKIR